MAKARTQSAGVTIERQIRFWLIGFTVFALALFFLRDVLLPFVAGMAVAYLLDPICDRFEKWGLSRTLATAVLTAMFVLVTVGASLLLVPAIAGQLVTLIKNTPDYIEALRTATAKAIVVIEARIDPAVIAQMQGALAGSTERLVTWASDLLAGLISGGVALANLVSLLIITPVVTFYLLRDWDKILVAVGSWLPRDHAPTIRRLASEVDERLAGFLRGQGMVCLILGAFYAIALSLADLQFGLIVGLVAGLASFIPFVGAIIGLLLSVGLALVQFDDWVRIAIIAGIFVFGQMLEGNFLTPRMIGERVGLHPVWIMFGLLAGGAVFGFVGLLLAVPATATIGVGVRFALEQYKRSKIYRGKGRDGDTDNETASEA
jgi:predicted PurR-regulated permease PerM